MKKIFYIGNESLPAGRQGFTIFFAMLVGSLSLAIGLSIYDLTVRELDLSATATQSQYAIYAADAGAECVLYWDSKYGPGGFGSAFATSSDTAPPTLPLTCVGQDIVAAGTPPTPYDPTVSTWREWDVVAPEGENAATTTFTLALGASVNSACAVVNVAKYMDNGSVATTITSKGFNVCSADITPRVERRFEVRY